MKKLLFSLSLLVTVFNSQPKAQTSFGENAQWTQAFISDQGGNVQQTYKSFIHPGVTKWLYFSPQDACGLHEKTACGDTIINQLVYKRLWTSSNYWVTPPYDNINLQWRESNEYYFSENSFLRQSNDSSRLYVYKNQNEFCIADMNLQVGDVFDYPGLGPDTVESVRSENGLKIIQFKQVFQQLSWNKLKFIEGIGPNRDITFIEVDNYYPHQLICYSSYNNFHKESGYECGCIINKTDKLNGNKFQLLKHKDYIEISFDEPTPFTWELYDTFGRKIQQSATMNEQKIGIPVSGLNNGIYFLRLWNSESNEFTSLKIML